MNSLRAVHETQAPDLVAAARVGLDEELQAIVVDEVDAAEIDADLGHVGGLDPPQLAFEQADRLGVEFADGRQDVRVTLSQGVDRQPLSVLRARPSHGGCAPIACRGPGDRDLPA